MNYDQSWRPGASAKKDAEQPRWRLSGHAANSTTRAQWLDLSAHHTDGPANSWLVGLTGKVRTGTHFSGYRVNQELTSLNVRTIDCYHEQIILIEVE